MNNKGRSKGLNKLSVLAVEILDDGVVSAYGEVIEHSSAIGLDIFLEKYISKEEIIITHK